ncbi:kinase-like protein [Sistotremastrum suecicum HHB10207 ss-3]|uniref:Kinase-like protein n=1 Tax=Sistotremastrum suecicum HHB10207 ss-3 TaxID=1314776 RepID=A0A165ZXL7_9AGAM|nr:kinase-like protein [Sistotremastrum suecicum HHB10207 ss-3]
MFNEKSMHWNGAHICQSFVLLIQGLEKSKRDLCIYLLNFFDLMGSKSQMHHAQLCTTISFLFHRAFFGAPSQNIVVPAVLSPDNHSVSNSSRHQYWITPFLRTQQLSLSEFKMQNQNCHELLTSLRFVGGEISQLHALHTSSRSVCLKKYIALLEETVAKMDEWHTFESIEALRASGPVRQACEMMKVQTLELLSEAQSHARSATPRPAQETSTDAPLPRRKTTAELCREADRIIDMISNDPDILETTDGKEHKKAIKVLMDEIHEAILCHPPESQDRVKLDSALVALSWDSRQLPPSPELPIEAVEELLPESPQPGNTRKERWMGASVAVKAIRHVPVSTLSYDRLYREMRRWRMLRHPNLMPFHGFFAHMDNVYLVLPDYHPGGVTRYLKENPDTNVTKIALEIAKGMNYLHSAFPNKPIIHGDIRAMNILLSSEGIAKLTNYGFSRVIEDGSQLPISTLLRGAGLTRWMAPELLEEDGFDDEGVSTKTDVWAWGMTVLELFTRAHPFVELEADDLIAEKVLNGGIPERPKALGTQRDTFWRLLKRCWHHDPAARPSSELILQAFSGARSRPIYS